MNHHKNPKEVYDAIASNKDKELTELFTFLKSYCGGTRAKQKLKDAAFGKVVHKVATELKTTAQ